MIKRLLSDYGMALVLLALCAFFSVVTYAEQPLEGEAGGRELARKIRSNFSHDANVLIAVQEHDQDRRFAQALQNELQQAGISSVETVRGGPGDARKALQTLSDARRTLHVVACNQATSRWLVFAELSADFPALGKPQVMQPESAMWPNFLKRDNLLNISNQIAVIAIVAIGMTMVIVSGGIDLSVGSLIALSAVTACWLIVNASGAESAGAWAMAGSCLAAIALCGAVGWSSGMVVMQFGVPPFIVTLATMLMASGLAYLLARGESIYQIPNSFVRLGRGADVLHIPNAVLLMLGLYAAAHGLMTRTRTGRYLYAVGGNAQAARLSGIPVRRVVVIAYTASGALAGLGGVVMASQLKSGSPTYGQMYELYTIAAVVVGGTSLAGGQGKIWGTLIGALIIAVIQNGMNLHGVEPYAQRIVLGLVILLAVLLDRLRQKLAIGGMRL